MKATALDKRLRALEDRVPVIDDLADYVLWQAHGRPSNIKWNPYFKKQLEEAFSKGKRKSSE